MKPKKWLQPYVGPFCKKDADGIAAALVRSETVAIETKIVPRKGALNYFDIMMRYES